MTGVRRQRQRLGAIVAMLLIVATACTTDEKETPDAAGDSRAKPALVVAAGEDGSQLEPPAQANVATGFGNANAPVFETLVALAPDFSIKPLLATTWELIPPNTWRFHLQAGVTFHNGTPFDAAAVVDNVTRLWAPDLINVTSLGPDSATVVDPLTVDLTPTKANFRLLEQLVHPVYGIQAPGTSAGAGTAPDSTPTGTGPFKFARYRMDVELEVVRFDGYWDPKAQAKAEKITFRFLPEGNARVLALEAGDVDAIYDVPRQLASTIDDPDVVIVKSAPGGYDALLLNAKGTAPHDILTDLAVRQAVAHGIDREAILEDVWRGNAEVMDTVIPAPVLGAHASLVKGYQHDRAEAGRLLDQAGWALGSDGVRAKDGRRLELTLVVDDAEGQRPVPELVQSQLKDIGIAVTLDAPGDPNVYFDKLLQGDGDMFVETGSQNDANPIFLGGLFTAEPGGFDDYASHFGAGPEYDQIFTRANSSPDTEEVRRLAAEDMHIAVDTVVVVVPIAGIDTIWGRRRNVEGFVPHPSAVHQRWSDVYATQ